MSNPASSPTARFVGRARELAALEAAWRARAGAFVPIYGRRRVGKSELIRRFVADKPAIYHVGNQAPAGLQIQEFLTQAARVLAEPLLAQSTITDWRQALEAVDDRWKGPGKLVVVLDEFQWTAGASPELPSLLQEIWDRRWQHGRVMLILCGSFVGFMEREVLGARSPLFGRRTAQIHLAPFGFREAAAFHPRWSRVDQARLWFLVGGVPAYLRAFDPDASIEQGLAAALLSEMAPLHREPEFLLREELRDVAGYQAVLYAVAAGAGTPREIAVVAGLPERGLHYHLDQLIQLGYIARRRPLTAATARRPTRAGLRFVLDDALLRTWFRFVYHQRSEIARLGPTAALAQLVRPHLDSFYGAGFERLAREALPLLWDAEGIAGPGHVGEYWSKHVQIDVVGVRGDGWIDLGECKWGAIGSSAGLTAELDGKIARYPNAGNATIERRLFVRTRPRGTQPRAGGTRWHTLDELYGDG